MRHEVQDSPIPHDCYCIRCGYNLRMLQSTGKCPECGAGIDASLRSDSLHGADLRWLTRIFVGAALMATGATLGALSIVLLVMFGIQPRSPSLSDVASLLNMMLFLLPPTLFAIGFFLLTTPEAHERSRPNRKRQWVRVAGVTVYFAGCALYWPLLNGAFGDATYLVTPLMVLAFLLLGEAGLLWNVALTNRATPRWSIEFAAWAGGVGIFCVAILVAMLLLGRAPDIGCFIVAIGLCSGIMAWGALLKAAVDFRSLISR